MIAKGRTLTLLRRAGIVGIVTGVALSIADISLLYSPAGGYVSDAMLLTIPMWRLLLGHYLGVLMLPFYLIAVWHLYEGLKPGGAWLAIPVAALLGYGLAAAGAFHGSFAVPALIAQITLCGKQPFGPGDLIDAYIEGDLVHLDFDQRMGAPARFTRDELWCADEVFLTGTAAEITPIREIDGRAIGRGSRLWRATPCDFPSATRRLTPSQLRLASAMWQMWPSRRAVTGEPSKMSPPRDSMPAARPSA